MFVGLYQETTSKHRQIDLKVPVNLYSLKARCSGAEQAIPNSSLFPIVVTFPPAPSVVQVVILDSQFTSEALEKWRDQGGRNSVYAQSGVSQDFFEEDV